MSRTIKTASMIMRTVVIAPRARDGAPLRAVDDFTGMMLTPRA
jgi:hypothetical protein